MEIINHKVLNPNMFVVVVSISSASQSDTVKVVAIVAWDLLYPAQGSDTMFTWW